MRNLLLVFLSLVLSSCQSNFIKAIYNFRAQTPAPIKKDIKVALVLGGGGSRSIAQIGVIEILEKNGIKADLIIGTSGGSIIGALYADSADIETVKKIGLNFKRADILNLSLKNAIEGARSLRGGFDGSSAEKFIEQNLKAQDFNQLKIPFIAVATDINSGQTVELRSGKIAPSVRASCAIPGLFSPVEIYGMTLVDGGVTAPLAIDIAKSYRPKLIIAVDVSLSLKKDKVQNMLELVHRSALLSYNALNELNGKRADILIKPYLEDVGIFDDHKNEEIYNAGKLEAEKYIKQIKAKLKK